MRSGSSLAFQRMSRDTWFSGQCTWLAKRDFDCAPAAPSIFCTHARPPHAGAPAHPPRAPARRKEAGPATQLAVPCPRNAVSRPATLAYGDVMDHSEGETVEDVSGMRPFLQMLSRGTRPLRRWMGCGSNQPGILAQAPDRSVVPGRDCPIPTSTSKATITCVATPSDGQTRRQLGPKGEGITLARADSRRGRKRERPTRENIV
eukprot:gene22586-biopygen23742